MLTITNHTIKANTQIPIALQIPSITASVIMSVGIAIIRNNFMFKAKTPPRGTVEAFADAFLPLMVPHQANLYALRLDYQTLTNCQYA